MIKTKNFKSKTGKNPQKILNQKKKIKFSL